MRGAGINVTRPNVGPDVKSIAFGTLALRTFSTSRRSSTRVPADSVTKGRAVKSRVSARESCADDI